MSLLEAHLEQIRISCHGIDALPFPPPKIFTNALLSHHDITSLIRDTEPHERALFSVPAPPAPPPHPSSSSSSSSSFSSFPARHPHTATSASRASRAAAANDPAGRRQTIFNVASGEVTTGPPTRAPRRHTAVAAVLGGEMHEQLRRAELGGDRGNTNASNKNHMSTSSSTRGDLDVDILLRGAEKLCSVYELPGARDRIAALATRFRNGRNTMAYYEARVAEQAEHLAAMNAGRMARENDADDDEAGGGAQDTEDAAWTEDDLRREEEEARMMEARKRELQMRLTSMQKDLGGLRDM